MYSCKQVILLWGLNEKKAFHLVKLLKYVKGCSLETSQSIHDHMMFLIAFKSFESGVTIRQNKSADSESGFLKYSLKKKRGFRILNCAFGFLFFLPT